MLSLQPPSAGSVFRQSACLSDATQLLPAFTLFLWENSLHVQYHTSEPWNRNLLDVSGVHIFQGTCTAMHALVQIIYKVNKMRNDVLFNFTFHKQLDSNQMAIYHLEMCVLLKWLHSAIQCTCGTECVIFLGMWNTSVFSPPLPLCVAERPRRCVLNLFPRLGLCTAAWEA